MMSVNEKPGPWPANPPPPPAERVAAEVEHPPLLGVGEDLVGGRDLLELLLRLGVRVDVGVVLPGQAAVRLLDGVGVGLPVDAEDLVRVHSLTLGRGGTGSGRDGAGAWRRAQDSSRIVET